MGSALPAGFERPFRVDSLDCYIWDADNRMAADFEDGAVRARGWGRIQYLPDGEAQMGAWEAFVCERCAGAESIHEACRRLNEVSDGT